ncbi:hypothetical protein PAMA110636_02970 [Paenibacillus macerans]
MAAKQRRYSLRCYNPGCQYVQRIANFFGKYQGFLFLFKMNIPKVGFIKKPVVMQGRYLYIMLSKTGDKRIDLSGQDHGFSETKSASVFTDALERECLGDRQKRSASLAQNNRFNIITDSRCGADAVNNLRCCTGASSGRMNYDIFPSAGLKTYFLNLSPAT